MSTSYLPFPSIAEDEGKKMVANAGTLPPFPNPIINSNTYL